MTMFKSLKNYFKKLKEKRDYIKFCHTTSDYIYMSYKRNRTHDKIEESAVMPQLKGITHGFVNSPETVYFKLMSVYGHNLTMMQIRGFRIEIKPDYSVVFHIYTHRPGLIIGKGGKDIDKLKDELEFAFGVPISIELHEEKRDIFSPYKDNW